MPSTLPRIAARARGRQPSKPRPEPRSRLLLPRGSAVVVSVLLLVVPSVVTVVMVMTMMSPVPVDDVGPLLRRRDESKDEAAQLTSSEEEEEATALIPPPSYPWHHLGHHSGNIDVDRFLRRVEEELNSDEIGPRSLLYLVRRDGGLWIKESHHRLVKRIDNGLYYHFRVRPFEEMVSRALEVAKRSANLNHPEMSKSVLGPGPDGGSEVVMPILFQWNDYGGCVDNDGYPIFAYAMPYYSPPGPTPSSDSDCLTFAIPGYDAWRKYGRATNPHPFDWKATHRRNDASFPWRSKIPKVVWRGSSTGSVHDYPDWRDMPRARLVRMAGIERPGVFDVGFTSLVQRNDSEVRSMEEEFGLKGRIPFRGFMRYRAVLDIDGNSWSTRFADLLCQNSVVVKVEPSYVDYFFRELRPWVHYVPVHSNLSNLVEIGTYVVSDENQGRMRRIVKAANGWCSEKLISTRMVADTLWILRSYVEVLDDGSGGRSRGDGAVETGAQAQDWRRRLDEIWEKWVHSDGGGGGGGAADGDDGSAMIRVGGQLSVSQEVAEIAAIYVLRPLLGTMVDRFSSSESSSSTLFRYLLPLLGLLSLLLLWLCSSYAAVVLQCKNAIFGGGRKDRSE